MQPNTETRLEDLKNAAMHFELLAKKQSNAYEVWKEQPVDIEILNLIKTKEKQAHHAAMRMWGRYDKLRIKSNQ